MVYVLRVEPRGPWGSSPPNALVDGKPVYPLFGSDYSAVYLEPGTHAVSIEPKPKLLGGMTAKEFAFEVKAGGVHAIGLEYRGGPAQPQIGIATPKGYFLVPLGPAPAPVDFPWVWDFYPDATINPIWPQLQDRWYRLPLTEEFRFPK